MTRFLWIFFFFLFLQTGTAQNFNGIVETKGLFIKGKRVKRVLRGARTHIIEPDSDTLYEKYTICGDTLIWEHYKVNGDFLSKYIQIGQKGYSRNLSTGSYSYMKINKYIDPHPLEEFDKEDWKPAKGKLKKDGFDYQAVYQKDRNYKYVDAIDTTAQYDQQLQLRGKFSLVFHPYGLLEKRFFTNNRVETIATYKYIVDNEMNCKSSLADFLVFPPDTFDIDRVKELFDSTLVATDHIIPVGKRKIFHTTEIRDQDNNEIDFRTQLIGKKYAYVDFWASWCGPCRVEMPYLKRIKNKYESLGLAVISISLDNKSSKWEWLEAIDKLKMDWTNWVIYDGLKSSLYEKLELKGIPRYLLIDSECRIVNYNTLRPSNANVESLLNQLLAENE